MDRMMVHHTLPPTLTLPLGVFIRYSYCMRESTPAYSEACPLVIDGHPPRRIPFHRLPDKGLVVVITIEIPNVFVAIHIISLPTSVYW